MVGKDLIVFNYLQERVYPDEIDYGNLLYIQMREDAVGLDERQYMCAGAKIPPTFEVTTIFSASVICALMCCMKYPLESISQ